MGSVKLTGKVESDNYAYNCYDIGFNSLSQFSLPGGSSGKNVITFELIILLLCILINIKKMTWKIKVPLTLQNQKKRFVLNLHYNEKNNSCLLMLQKHITSKQKTLK